MRKQITSLLLTLAMLLSLVPTLGVTASAAEGDAYYPQGGIQTYQDFSTLLASQVTREIKLLKDIEYTLGSEDEEIEMTYQNYVNEISMALGSAAIQATYDEAVANLEENILMIIEMYSW